MNFETIAEDIAFLDEWEDRYRYVIDLGKALEPLDDADYDDAFKVPGCASQVWLRTDSIDASGETRLRFRGDSDAHIVRGLVAVLIALYSDKTPREILDIDPKASLGRLGLEEQLTPQRSNGLYSMVSRIRRDAETSLA